MAMFSVFIEVEPGPLAEAQVVREEDVVDWFKDKFELYKGVPGEIIFRAQKLEDKGIDPEVPNL